MDFNDDGANALGAKLIDEHNEESFPMDAELLYYLKRCRPHRIATHEPTRAVAYSLLAGEEPEDCQFWAENYPARVVEGQAMYRQVLAQKKGDPRGTTYDEKTEYQCALETAAEPPVAVDIEELLQAPHLAGSRSAFQDPNPPAPFFASKIPIIDGRFPDGVRMTKYSNSAREVMNMQTPDDYLEQHAVVRQIHKAMVHKAEETIKKPLDTDFILTKPRTEEEWAQWERENSSRVHTSNLLPHALDTQHFRVKHGSFVILWKHPDTGKWMTWLFPTTFSMAGMVRDGDVSEVDKITGTFSVATDEESQ